MSSASVSCRRSKTPEQKLGSNRCFSLLSFSPFNFKESALSDSGTSDTFVVSPMRDNWYQRCSFLGSSFALITTVDEAGQTNIGPYQLSFPFEVNTRRSWMVISRNTSNTATNVYRTKKCALNFIEYDEEQIKTVLKFGYPGQTVAQKMAYNCFELIGSPTPGREPSEIYPKILAEAFQVYECTLDIDRINENPILRDSPSAHLLLNIDTILVKERWMKYIDGSGDKMPNIAMTYGFRGGSTFWFGEPKPAYPTADSRHGSESRPGAL